MLVPEKTICVGTGNDDLTVSLSCGRFWYSTCKPIKVMHNNFTPGSSAMLVFDTRIRRQRHTYGLFSLLREEVSCLFVFRPPLDHQVSQLALIQAERFQLFGQLESPYLQRRVPQLIQKPLVDIGYGAYGSPVTVVACWKRWADVVITE